MRKRDQRATNAAYYRRNRLRELERVRGRQRGTIELLRGLRERPCSDCLRSFAPHQMDFDHRPGTVKSFRLTSGGAMLRPTSTILAEAAKCDVVCANCHRVRTQRRHALALAMSPWRSSAAERKRQAWRAHGRLLDELRAAPCVDCHGRFPACAMDFDHRDPESKRNAVTRMIGRAGEARILEEVAKCDIVCANCHRLRTFTRRSNGSVRE